MKFIFRLFKSPNFFPLLVVFIFALFASRSLIFERGYFNMHDDLQMMRQLELEKCFSDGQIPCRWIPDMGYGYGFPLFNFYPPLPYLVGELFRIIGFSFVETAKLTFALSFFLSGFAMYFLAKEFFGRLGGILSAIFYIWAPYHSVDVYVRGAMNEAWALVFFPMIFYSSYKLIKSDKRLVTRWTLFLSFSFACLLLTHNLMVIIVTPFFALWVFMNLWIGSAWKKLINLILAGTLALGLSSFFTLPAIFENSYTQIKTQLTGYYDFSAHFVTLRQLLFSRFWGYGPSVWLEEDGMPFQIGHLHWILPLFVVGALLILVLLKRENFIKKIKSDPLFFSVIFMFCMGWAAAFMAHPRSIFVYHIVKSLEYVQFPWRFLTLVIFAFSFVVGAIPGFFAKLKSGKNILIKVVALPPQLLTVFVLSLTLILLNWNYFRPEYGKMGPLTDEEKFNGRAWMLQQTAGIYDYLPSYAKEAPKEPPKQLAEIIDSEGLVSDMYQGTYWGKFNAKVESGDAKVRINILNFPGWRVFVNGVETSHFVDDSDKWGRIWVTLPEGQHAVYVQFLNTPIRTIGNIISVIALLIFIGVTYRISKNFNMRIDSDKI